VTTEHAEAIVYVMGALHIQTIAQYQVQAVTPSLTIAVETVNATAQKEKMPAFALK
jgi:hypothetical protein